MWCADMVIIVPAGITHMVKLSDVAEVLESSNSTVRFYYDRKEDEVVCIIDAFLPAQKSILRKVESDNGSKYVIIEPQCNIAVDAMASFAESLPDGELREDIMSAVSAGGVRRFMDKVESAEMLDRWREFRAGFVADRARGWCLSHDVPVSERWLRSPL